MILSVECDLCGKVLGEDEEYSELSLPKKTDGTLLFGCFEDPNSFGEGFDEEEDSVSIHLPKFYLEEGHICMKCILNVATILEDYSKRIKGDDIDD